MGFKLSEVSDRQDIDALEDLKKNLTNLDAQKIKVKLKPKADDLEYEAINIISFKRSLYRLKTNYQDEDQKNPA